MLDSDQGVVNRLELGSKPAVRGLQQIAQPVSENAADTGSVRIDPASLPAELAVVFDGHARARAADTPLMGVSSDQRLDLSACGAGFGMAADVLVTG
jgi:hypothetical protein